MVKIRHLGRVLLGLATLFVVGITSTTTATAQVTSTTVVSSLTDLASASTDGTWCVLYNTGRHWFIQDNMSGSVAAYSGTVTSESNDASAASGIQCIVKFVSTGTDNVYKIQTVSGNYFSTLSSDNQVLTLVSSADNAGTFTVSANSNTAGYYQLKSSGGKNLEGGEASVLGWGSSDLTSISGTNNGLYQISTVVLGDGTDGSTAAVTYNYVYNNNTLATSTSTQFVGLKVEEPASKDFLSISSYDETTVVASSGTTVNITCDQDLPFTVTTDDSNPYYYVLDVHSDDNAKFTVGSSSFFVKGEGESVAASDNDIKALSLNEVPAEAYQWIIKGDLINGFTFCNRSTQSYITITTGSNDNQATLSSTATKFFLAKSTITNTSIPNISDAICLYADGNKSDSQTIYLNHRDTENGVLKGWTDADGGSTFIVRPVSFFAETYYENNYKVYQDAPAGAYGTLKDADFTAAKAAIATLSENPCDADAAAALVEANTTLGACSIIEVPTDYTSGYYRLYNYKEHKYLTYNGNNLNDQESGTSIGSVVKFTATDTEGQYYMSVEGVNLGQIYMYNASSLNTSADSYVAAKFTISQTSGIYTFFDNSTTTATYATWYPTCRYLHVNSGNATGWYANSTTNNGPSYWYVLPADIAEVSLTTIGDNSYATTCLPFGVSQVAGATANIGAIDTEKKEITPTAITTIPANTGVILIGEANAEKATLTIGTASDITGTNNLLGTCVNLANNSYLTLGRLTGTEATATAPGFYTYTGETISANRAYLSGTDLSTIRLVLDGNTTGIDAATLINGEQSNAPVYDLSGRRVLTPAKGGIYLQGGKKYIAR